MMNLIVTSLTLWVAQGAGCTTATYATGTPLGFCKGTACACDDDDGGTSTNCSNTLAYATLAGDATDNDVNVCTVHGNSGTLNAGGAHKLYFPGEEFTPAARVYCASQSRNTFNSAATVHLQVAATTAAVYATLNTPAAESICAFDSSTTAGTVAALAKTATVAHAGVAPGTAVPVFDATATKGVSLTINQARTTETGTAGQIFDRYLDIAYVSGTANTHGAIATTARIANGSPSTATAFRCVALNKQTAANQIGSYNCPYTSATDYTFCAAGYDTATGLNPTATTKRCIPLADILAVPATGTQSLYGSERLKGAAAKWAIGVNFFGIFDTNSAADFATVGDASKYTLNIAATARNKFFVLTTKVLAHGAVSTAALVTAGNNVCLSKNAAEASCADKFICNAGGGATNTGSVCIDHKLLLGDVSAGWTKAKQARQPGSGATGSEKLCLATTGAAAPFTYWVKGCKSTPAADKEICNPNATTYADTCIKESTTLAHGEFWTKAVTPATATSAPEKNTCIGDTAYSTAGTEGQVCNWGGGAADPKVFITAGKTKTTFEYLLSGSATVADKAVVQAADGELLKYCFNNGGAAGENHAVICKKGVTDDTKDPPKVTTEQEVCNIYGTQTTADAAAPHKQVCIEKRQLVPTGHGHVIDADNIDKKTTTKVEEIVCIGPDGADSNKTLGYKCDAKAGKFYVGSPPEKDTILPAWVTRVAKGEDGEKKTRCWGTVAAGSIECAEGFICNPAGTTAAGYTDLADAITEVCIKAEDFAVEINGLCKKETALTDGTDAVTYCVPATTTAAPVLLRRVQEAEAEAEAEAEEPAGNPDYCDKETGTCTAVDPATDVDATGEGADGSKEADGSNASNNGIVMASVAAMVSV